LDGLRNSNRTSGGLTPHGRFQPHALYDSSEYTNNGFLNHSFSTAFNTTVNDIGVMELPLLDRLFT
jgi:hypothetical protein